MNNSYSSEKQQSYNQRILMGMNVISQFCFVLFTLLDISVNIFNSNHF